MTLPCRPDGKDPIEYNDILGGVGPLGSGRRCIRISKDETETSTPCGSWDVYDSTQLAGDGFAVVFNPRGGFTPCVNTVTKVSQALDWAGIDSARIDASDAQRASNRDSGGNDPIPSCNSGINGPGIDGHSALLSFWDSPGNNGNGIIDNVSLEACAFGLDSSGNEVLLGCTTYSWSRNPAGLTAGAGRGKPSAVPTSLWTDAVALWRRGTMQ